MKKFTKRVSLILMAFVIAMSVTTFGTSEAMAATKTTTSKPVVKTAISKKNYTLKKASNVSKTVTTTTTTKTTKTTLNNSSKKVVENKTVKKVTKNKFKKNSRIKSVTTTVKTTTVTTTTLKSTSGSSVTSISQLEAKADPTLVKSFKTLGFKTSINKKSSHLGVFSPSRRLVELKSYDSGVYLHEMGHFLSHLKNKIGQSAEFKKIYAAEKSKYTGSNKNYVTSTSEEYFAESYRDYEVNAAKLKSARPKTYNFIHNTVKSISDSDVKLYRAMWSWSW